MAFNWQERNYISIYVREGTWHYSADELKEKLNFRNDDEFIAFVRVLKSRNLLSYVKVSDNAADDEDSNEEEEIFSVLNDKNLVDNTTSFRFDFVGIIIFKGRIIYAYPKYIGALDKLPDIPPKKELQQVIKVIEQYSLRKKKLHFKDIAVFEDIDFYARTENVLPIIFFILEDYAKHGLYEKEEAILENNGSGEIYWQKTIDETFPLIDNNQPIYTDLYTLKNVSDDLDYIRRLHAYIVKQCFDEVKKTDLVEFLSLPEVDITEFDGDDFGNEEYVLRRIEQEMNSVFVDRKVRLLKAMYAYINSNRVLFSEDSVQLIGTNAFNLVWEWVCAEVFQSQKDDSIKSIPALDAVSANFEKPPTLVQLIEKPIWNIGGKLYNQLQTLKPDYLRFEQKNSSYEFYILDAKYYRPIIQGKNVCKAPSVADITKQYMYFMYYKQFFERHEISCEMKNYFLMPKPTESFFDDGNVEFEFLNRLGWGRIEIRLLDPEKMYDLCLSHQHKKLSELDANQSNIQSVAPNPSVVSPINPGRRYGAFANGYQQDDDVDEIAADRDRRDGYVRSSYVSGEDEG